jgi:hypothetical protein
MASTKNSARALTRAYKKKIASNLAVWEFRKTVKEFKKITKEIYSINQDKLPVLMKTGRGNCVAFSKLFRKICKKRKVRVYHARIRNITDKKEHDHQLSLVYDDRERIIWLQTNGKIFRFKNFSRMIKFAGNEVGWNLKQTFMAEFWEV